MGVDAAGVWVWEMAQRMKRTGDRLDGEATMLIEVS